MIQGSGLQKDYVIIDMSFMDEKVNSTSKTSVNRDIRFVNLKNEHAPSRHDSALTLNDFLDTAIGCGSSLHGRRFDSQLSINDILDGIDVNSINRNHIENKDVIIDIVDTPSSSSNNTSETRSLLSSSLNGDDMFIEIDERITKILECKYKYQLDSIVGDIIPKEDESAEKVSRIMRIYNEQYNKVYSESHCLYKAYMSFHSYMEKLLPYSFRAGGSISFHLLIQALFFNGDYGSSLSMSDSSGTTVTPPTTIKTDAFLSSSLSLGLPQVRMIGDLIAASLFHAPTILYQYPKLVDEINQCLEKRTITGSVIARLALCITSTLLTISPLLMLGGAAKAGTIMRYVGRGVSYLDIPLVLVILGESWYEAYKNGSSANKNAAQRFISQESAFKTTQRVLTQGLSLISSLSGTILRSLEKGTAPEMMSLFIVNTLNLLFHQNPYEGSSSGLKALKRATYQHNYDAFNVQTIALYADLQCSDKITAPLFNIKDRLSYAVNLQRSGVADQVLILKETVKACSQGERAILDNEQEKQCLKAIDNIYYGDLNESDTDLLPSEMKDFLIYLNKLHSNDVSCMSLGNEVNEKIIAVIIKTLAFRETVLNGGVEN